MSSIYDWSITSANNANADSLINWAEGQPPGSVNNSARAMMQRTKELLNDLGGVVVAGGSANALTIAASSPFIAYEDGLRVSFRAAAGNTAAATLSVNSIGAKPIHVVTSSGVAAVSAGQIQANGIFEAVYSTILNGGAGAWLLLNPTINIPVEDPGFIKAFGGTTAPAGFLVCNGAAVNRSTYAKLFAAIGTTWGNGNGSTTFNVPDLRNEFLRGSSGTLTVGTKQTDAIKNHKHTGETNTVPDHTHGILTTTENTGGGPRVERTGTENPSTVQSQPAGSHKHTFETNDNTGGDALETRPRNAVVLWVIKT